MHVRFLFRATVVLGLLAGLSSCGILGLGGSYYSQGTNTDPWPIHNAAAAAVSVDGEVAAGESSFYDAEVWPGRDYVVLLDNPDAGIALGIYSDPDFSDSLAVADVERSVVRWVETVTAKGPRLYLMVSAGIWNGTGFSITVKDKDDYETEGSVAKPVDMGEASALAAAHFGITKAAGSYYSATVDADSTYNVSIEDVDTPTILAVGSDPEFGDFIETAPVNSSSKTLSISTAGITTLYIHVYRVESGVEEFSLNVQKQ